MFIAGIRFRDVGRKRVMYNTIHPIYSDHTVVIINLSLDVVYSHMYKVPNPRTDCAIDAAMSVFEGRWKPVILCRMLREDRPLRFKELFEGIRGISARILTKQLKEMEADRLITRKEFSESPPRVEYSLTERGRSLGPVLYAIGEWGRENMFSNRVTFDHDLSVSD